jgi:site-specific recombinase XerC
MVLPLEPTGVRGVCRRGSKFVAVYRAGGRQRKQAADTLAEARAIKLARAGQARAARRGPTLHAFSLSWLDRYAGSGHDVVREATRREYRRLLVNFALVYFDRELLVRDHDRVAVQHFVDRLTTRPGRDGRLCDRSIANAITPLRLTLGAAVAEGLLDANPADGSSCRAAGPAGRGRHASAATSPAPSSAGCSIRCRRGGGRCSSCSPRPGCGFPRPSGCVGSDLCLDGEQPHVRVRRAIVKGILVAPKSRHGARLIPLSTALAETLRQHRPDGADDDAFVFPGRDGRASDQGSLRRRVLSPAAQRAGLGGVGFHTLRHTCASMLIESGLSPLRLQCWMGHHSPAFTLETYGHLIDGDLGPALDLRTELPPTHGG